MASALSLARSRARPANRSPRVRRIFRFAASAPTQRSGGRGRRRRRFPQRSLRACLLACARGACAIAFL
eukprot:14778130-Alexandrium_andersonii.AAC.1